MEDESFKLKKKDYNKRYYDKKKALLADAIQKTQEIKEIEPVTTEEINKINVDEYLDNIVTENETVIKKKVVPEELKEVHQTLPTSQQQQPQPLKQMIVQSMINTVITTTIPMLMMAIPMLIKCMMKTKPQPKPSNSGLPTPPQQCDRVNHLSSELNY